MRGLSIKARVTIWYSTFLVFLLVVNIGFLLSVSNQISNRQLSDRLRDIVTDTLKNARFKYGKLDDEKIDYYRNGVSVFLYDTSGHLLAPKINKGLQVDSILEDQVIKRINSRGEKWLVYDLYAVADNTGFWVRGIISLTETKQTLGILLLLAFISIPIFILIAAFGGWKITKKAFLPVREMARSAEAISSGNDLSIRVEEKGARDELSSLAKTMNDMLARLQSSFEAERQFTSDASHELRTPISVVLSQCEYALQDEISSEEKTEALQSIFKQADRMSKMISQLLLLARVDNGKYQLHLERIDISYLCEMVVSNIESEGLKYHVRIQTDIEKNVFIMGDEMLLFRMFTNLLSNAIHYNKEDGRVILTVATKGGRVIIRVSDTGIGIEKEQLEKIWNRFYRIDSSRSGEGTGLGLAIVKWIVKVHQGEIKVDSIYGRGTTFEVVLAALDSK